MFLKYILLLLLLVSSEHLIAQRISIENDIKKVDSLIFYNNFSEAEKVADRLYNLLEEKYNEKSYMDLKLAVIFQKVDIYILNKRYSKATSMALDIIDLAKKFNLPNDEYQGCLKAALVYEISSHYDLCKIYLNRAYKLYSQKKLENIFSTYCIRVSSYYHLVNKEDSAIHFAYKGLDYAKRFPNPTGRDLSDAYMLLCMLLPENEYKKKIEFGFLAIEEFLKRNDYAAVVSMYNNISNYYIKNQEFDKAFLYNDSAIWFYKKYSLDYHCNFIYKNRAQLFDFTGNGDSAYFYFKLYHEFFLQELKNQDAIEIINITERYQNDKKETVIRGKNQQLFLIIIILVVIAMATVLLIRKNKKINAQNKVISKQLEELMRLLEQKQVLLSELRHRVKNNLQHVISILEIQKESVDFNNIDELIRGNQNRIHSMALLHKKLNVSENVNDVDLSRYITELSELVKDSYNSYKKKINLNINCEIKEMSIEKALPLGLIVVELVSNSMKHAFKSRSIGIITISIKKNNDAQKNILYYSDNGGGFNFNTTTAKGLGIEIIKGLIDQLDGTVETKQGQGFELSIYFN